jgi:hypothetical protein
VRPLPIPIRPPEVTIMAGQTICTSCGESVPAGRLDEDPEQRTPCDKCGSTGRSYRLKAETGHFVLTGGDVTLTVVRYPEVLLRTAQRLFDSGEYAVAVVVAHTACEVAVERVISQSFARSNIPQVADPVDGLLNGSNISNPKVRSLFDALTGKKVAQDKQGIWDKFMKSATRRNRAVHAGEQPTKTEAGESLDVAYAMVQYLVPLIQ